MSTQTNSTSTDRPSSRCEACGEQGRPGGIRDREPRCPKGWNYGKFIDVDNPALGELLVLFCCRACAAVFWTRRGGRNLKWTTR